MGIFVPEEILSYIMQYLSVSDRKVASLVCRDWYRASLDRLLMSDIVFTFQSWSALDNALPALQMRYGTNVVLQSVDNSMATRTSIATASLDSFSGIRSLSLAGCDVTEIVFALILTKCTSLEVLDLSQCNALFMTGQLLTKTSDVETLKTSLSHVREVRLSSIRYLSDASFNRLMSVCPGIKSLSLTGNQIVFHTDIYFSCGEQSKQANSAVLTFANVLNFVKVNAAQLTSLDLSRSAINDDALSALAKVENLKLKELRLAHCQELTDTGIAVLSKLQPSLRLLDVSDCLALKDKSLEAICINLVGLQDLRIARCRLITDLSICKLRGLRHLRSLDLNACYTVTSRALGLGLCSTVSPMCHLTSLIVACCSSIRDGYVIEMSKCMPNITNLDLSSCGVGNTGLHAISTVLTHLRHLKLAWCQDITDAGLLGVRDNESLDHHCHDEDDVGLCRCTRRIQSLHIFDPPRASVSQNHKTPPTFNPAHIYPITNLKKLRTLDLTSCHRITDAGVAKVMSFLELRCLHLSLCPAITDFTLAAIVSGLPSLEELHLAQCTHITDVGVVRLTEKVRRLTVLNISKCDQLTNRTMDALYMNSKQLKLLDVSFCGGITAEAIDMLENGLGNLTSVHKRYCGIRT